VPRSVEAPPLVLYAALVTLRVGPLLLRREYGAQRVPLRTVLASLAEGATVDEILKDFSTLTEQDVRAAIAFAAASAQKDLPVAEAHVL